MRAKLITAMILTATLLITFWGGIVYLMVR